MDISLLALRTPLKTCNSCHSAFPPNPNPTIERMDEYLSQHRNRRPSYKELTGLKYCLDSAKQDLKAYTEEIQRIGKVLQELETRKGVLAQATSRIEQLLRPSILRLPVEILLAIFYIYVENSGRNEGKSCAHPALTIGRVCSQWRDVVYSSSGLWSEIYDEEIPSYDSTSGRRFTQLCLRNSGELPLQISFLSHTPEMREPFLEVVKHSRRWKHVTVDCFPSYCDFPADVPMLETLTLTGPSHRKLPAIKVLSPALRRLRLYDELGGSFRFDTSSLTHFSLENVIDFFTFFNILERSPMLTTLEVERMTFRSSKTLDSPLSLPQLTSLAIRDLGTRTSPVCSFSNNIAVPQLTNLSIAGRSDYALGLFDPQITSSRAISISPPPLTSLTLSFLLFNCVQDLFDILTPFNDTLTSLSLVMCLLGSRGEWDELLRRMTFPQSDRLLENLKELEFGYRPWTRDYDTLFLDMVESRWRVDNLTSRLLRLRVACSIDSDKMGVANNLSVLSEQGLEVDIYSSET
ncbi:hypothetical protein E1B28_011765 [Marasmius oreades]|uniref:F-box domain-containing protein n=1 Tax=Marasmius oreades TaxID=181124 RepID=A0A9P7RVV9_9AGAR|nr:uncharacterized protein E1B28_011765 [Marasmius oreades]KAG7090156.1 hypothetical protein E1B28_011765 [Marasmius oreades]